MVLLVYRMTEELSSLISVIQLMIAPEKTPGSIMGIVTRRNVLSCDAPRLMDASSTLGLICPMMAVLDRIVYGMRRMESDITMMSTVPPSINGGPLKAYRNEMPSTEPGMMYGNMVSTSSTEVSALRLRTLRYEISIPHTTTITMAIRPKR